MSNTVTRDSIVLQAGAAMDINEAAMIQEINSHSFSDMLPSVFPAQAMVGIIKRSTTTPDEYCVIQGPDQRHFSLGCIFEPSESINTVLCTDEYLPFTSDELDDRLSNMYSTTDRALYTLPPVASPFCGVSIIDLPSGRSFDFMSKVRNLINSMFASETRYILCLSIAPGNLIKDDIEDIRNYYINRMSQFSLMFDHIIVFIDGVIKFPTEAAINDCARQSLLDTLGKVGIPHKIITKLLTIDHYGLKFTASPNTSHMSSSPSTNESHLVDMQIIYTVVDTIATHCRNLCVKKDHIKFTSIHEISHLFNNESEEGTHIKFFVPDTFIVETKPHRIRISDLLKDDKEMTFFNRHSYNCTHTSSPFHTRDNGYSRGIDLTYSYNASTFHEGIHEVCQRYASFVMTKCYRPYSLPVYKDLTDEEISKAVFVIPRDDRVEYKTSFQIPIHLYPILSLRRSTVDLPHKIKTARFSEDSIPEVDVRAQHRDRLTNYARNDFLLRSYSN